MKKSSILEIRESLTNYMNSYSIDFINEYSINNNERSYLSDIITEFADGSISIYYVDQFNYWNDHSTECEDALLELYDKETITDIINKQGLYNLCCSAGVCGWFREIENDIYNDIENVCKCLLLDYVLDNFNKFNKKDISYIEDALDNVNYNNIDKLSDILNIL